MKIFNLKAIIYSLGQFLFSILSEFRRLYWNLPFHYKSTIHSLTIYHHNKVKYFHRGDIALIVFMFEPLLFLRRSFEYTSFKLMSELIKKNDYVLDVGANTGLYSLFFSRLVTDTGKVFAFEPGSETYLNLIDNLELNNVHNIDCIKAALSNEVGEAFLTSYDEKTLAFQGDSFKYISKHNSQVSDELGDKIQTLTIDSFVEEKSLSRVDFIKIDVEGAEKLVLEGAIETLKKFRPKIIYECSNAWSKRFSYKPYEIVVLLHTLNYEITEYDHEQWLAVPRESVAKAV